MAIEDYGWADRMVHRLAFKSRVPQQVLIDLERRNHGDAIAAQPLTAPIFVTSLARAGTTVLLEILAAHPDLVTHNHRDMPFVLSPIQWRAMTGRFQVSDDKKERSHGDGLMVNADSPEAFEEIAWVHAFPDHYDASGIEPWDDLPPAFRTEFSDHMRALIVSRGGGEAKRYLSKNNANIARIDALGEAFTDARFLVPLRDPFDHAASLLKQHRKALASHEQAFARDYAAYAGHFEFGAVHRPIMFPGMAEVAAAHDPDEFDYWLGYWICAYRHLAKSRFARFLDMTRFTREKPLASLFGWLGLEADRDVVAHGNNMIRDIPHGDHETRAAPLLRKQAAAVYAELRGSEAALVLT